MRDRLMLVGDAEDQGTWRVEYRNHRPPNFIGWVPIDVIENKYEDVAWLQIETIKDPDRGLIQVITVDAPKKAQLLADRAAVKVVKDELKAARKNKLKKQKKFLKDFQKDDVADLEGIKTAIDGLIDIVKELSKELHRDTD